METTRSRRRRSHGGRPILFRNEGLWIAFAAPILIMLIIFIQRGIFPFGDQTYLRTDLYHQYAPFFSEFRHKLQTGGSLLYSWDIGLGVNFAALSLFNAMRLKVSILFNDYKLSLNRRLTNAYKLEYFYLMLKYVYQYSKT